MTPRRLFFLALSALTFALPLSAKDPADPARWEKDIAALEAKQARQAAAPGALLFVGSSSIRLWDLAESWPGEAVVNQGFGGSCLPDSVHFFDRLVTPLRPRAIVVYAGDNDISKGATAEDVVASFEALVAKRDKALPGIPLIYVAIKPSIRRWNLWPEMQKANEAISALCDGEKELFFADIAAPMLKDAEAAPAQTWFAKDGLHLSPEGYQGWTKTVSAALREAGVLK